MKLREVYRLAVKMGMSKDPRGEKGVKRVLDRIKDNFGQLREEEREFFDIEKLTNPYSDTRILCGDLEMEITGVLAGIDLEVPEVLLADRLNEKGERINLLLAHHPEGSALAALPEVMAMQADIWGKLGVPINIGDVLIDKRMKEVHRALLPLNHNRAVDAARLLGFAFMTIHTPADNLVTSFLQKIFDEEKPYTVKDIADRLRRIPEYNYAAKDSAGPTILVGEPDRRAGKVVVDMTGGTEGPEEAIERLADAGVGTLVGMHMGDKLRKRAEKHHINVVIAGHIASDAVGINLFLDELEKKGVKIIVCSGLRRVRRT
ncbi:MAG: NGG1p interacting factor NIF3 [Actinomycetota bacterium]|nr:NGG1p interacting factor NIF3 [Actinomycetota bacterium]MDI6822217.1 NGG1p interacting factor NIF3 [Actinomycetota bacterium]